jgi:hypothetical protein
MITDEIWKTVSDNMCKRTLKYKELLDVGLTSVQSNLNNLPDGEIPRVGDDGTKEDQSDQ